MAKESKTKWIIRRTDGRIKGPYTAEQVVARIKSGRLGGEEWIAAEMGGRWIPISRAPEFSDHILDALASDSNAPMRPMDTLAGTDDSLEEQSVEAARDVTNPKIEFNRDESEEPPPPPLMEVTGGSSAFIDQKTSTKNESVIELTDLKQLERKERIRSSKLPLILIGTAVVLALAALFLPDGKSNYENRIRLIAPRKNQPELSEAKIKDKLRRALGAFQTDTFSGYLKAQNELVEALEGAPQNPEYATKKAGLASTLCLVYRELWPFAFQDSKDSKAISTVMQEAKRLDPGGLNGALCEIVQLALSGRYRDAQGLTDSMLVEQSQAPVLFEIRGDLYFSGRDSANAATYFAQARNLWPAWQKSSVQEARARTAQNQIPQAMQLYRNVLAAIPQHAVAKIELGLIELNRFNHPDKGYEFLRAGLDGTERVPRNLEASGYFGLAQIHLKRNQKSKALDYARKAYALNSANQAAKDMIVQLAGAEELKNTKVDGRELVYLGDQYVRAGDCFSAQAQFKAAFEMEPKNGMAALKAGKCLWQLNQSEEAIEWMKKAIAADSHLIAAYVELADYYAQRFDYMSAMRVLQKIQQLSPQSYEVYRGFATVELRRNNFQGAMAFAQRALKLYESDLDTFLIMAKALHGMQQFPEAQKFAGKAIELDYNNVEAQSLYGKIEAGMHGVDAGAEYIQQQINRYVIVAGQQVPQAAVEYRVTLGEIYLQDERYPLAEGAFRQALSLDPNNKKALLKLGRVLQALNRAPDALEVFLKAAVLDPSDAEPIFQSAQVYADVGKLNDAIAQYQRVLKVNPRYPRAHVQLGRAYLKLSEPKKAIEEAMEERKVNPDLAEAYLLAGEAYFDLKQYTNCAAEYQKAVAKKAQGSKVLVQMARCYRLTGALESAQSLLRQAVALESGNPDLYKEQGAIFHMKGMADEAIGAYDTYLKLVPNAPDRLEIEGRMQRIQSGDTSTGE